MSEILIEVPDQVEQPSGYGPETVDDWFKPLYDLVMANANVVDRWPWLGGVEAPLSTSMWNHAPVTADNVSEVVAEISGLLSKHVEKVEELDADDESAEDDAAQDQVEQIETETAEAEVSSDNEPSQTEQAETPASTSEDSSGGQIQVMAVTETTANVSDDQTDIISENDPEVLEKADVKTKVAERPIPHKPISKIEQELSLPKAQPIRAKTFIKPSAELKLQAETIVAPELNSSQPIVQQEVEPKIEKALSLNPDNSNIEEQNEVEPEITLEQVKEIQLELVEPNAFSIPMWEELEAELGTKQEPLEVINPEQPFQMSMELEEIENVLVQLTETIETINPDTTEALNEILDKIIEVPAMLEAGNGSISEVEAQEQLEELFIELFELAGIDYTPELIESLAHLVIKSRLVEQIDKLKYEEAKLAPQGIGTHEVIKKILAALSFIRKLIARAAAVGKSALKLYTLSFAN